MSTQHSRGWQHNDIYVYVSRALKGLTVHGQLPALNITPTVIRISTVYSNRDIYCCVPARWGLQQTTLAPGRDGTWARDPE